MRTAVKNTMHSSAVVSLPVAVRTRIVAFLFHVTVVFLLLCMRLCSITAGHAVELFVLHTAVI